MLALLSLSSKGQIFVIILAFLLYVVLTVKVVIPRWGSCWCKQSICWCAVGVLLLVIGLALTITTLAV